MRIDQFICLLILLVATSVDLWRHEISVWLLGLGSILVVALRIIDTEMPILLWITGGLIGVLFLLVSKCTEEAFGYGDSCMIIILGLYLGLWDLLVLLFIAFFLSSLISIGWLLKRGFQREGRIPFVPFLAIAYIGVQLL